MPSSPLLCEEGEVAPNRHIAMNEGLPALHPEKGPRAHSWHGVVHAVRPFVFTLITCAKEINSHSLPLISHAKLRSPLCSPSPAVRAPHWSTRTRIRRSATRHDRKQLLFSSLEQHCEYIRRMGVYQKCKPFCYMKVMRGKS